MKMKVKYLILIRFWQQNWSHRIDLLPKPLHVMTLKLRYARLQRTATKMILGQNKRQALIIRIFGHQRPRCSRHQQLSSERLLAELIIWIEASRNVTSDPFRNGPSIFFPTIFETSMVKFHGLLGRNECQHGQCASITLQKFLLGHSLRSLGDFCVKLAHILAIILNFGLT